MNASTLFSDTLVTGLPYVPLVMGVYLVFRIRNDFDLTVDGSFATGGAVTATALLAGRGVAVSMLLALLAAGAAGLFTAGLHIVLRIPVILAGLVTSIGLFSVNLHIMGQVPSLALSSAGTLFSGFNGLSSAAATRDTIFVSLGFAVAVLVAMGLFLRTEIGLALRVSGVNVPLARSQGVNERAQLALSLFIANALAGLSGALVVQEQSFADVNMGVGVLLTGIAAFLVGELVTRPSGSKLLRGLAAVLIGALLYRFILVFALQAGLAATDLNLTTAVTLIVAFVLQRVVQAGLERRNTRRGRRLQPVGAAPPDAESVQLTPRGKRRVRA
jgi:putative ABC transport system permease protein